VKDNRATACGRGLSRAAVARELNLDIQTVWRFPNAACAEELLGKVERRSTKLDPFIDLVNQRWNAYIHQLQLFALLTHSVGAI
jgi:hypothetical protein